MATIRDTLKNVQSKLYLGVGFSSDEAKLEARFILEHVLKISQKDIIQEANRPIDILDQEFHKYLAHLFLRELFQ